MLPALIVFLKNPIAGKTKTRLAATVGHTRALEIYHELVAHTRTECLAAPATRYVYYSDFIPETDGWERDDIRAIQQGADLGNRMQAAFQAVFRAGHQRAVIIGSDCLGLTTDLLIDAFDCLNERKSVLGPALDGGYYLIGLRASTDPAVVFQNMTWSVDDVAQITRERLANAGYSLGELSALSDVDHEEDWIGYGRKV